MISDDDTPGRCCAAGICCDRAAQKTALADLLAQHTQIKQIDAWQAAQNIIDAFDLVPRGLIGPLIAYVREHPHG